ncbi:MAG TPA: protein kinase [Edaphobacter sp.]|nr:protein kinase [Edaphobacter sp.]
MALAPGTRLGPHEILSLLGVGGMGEVYRARDTRLERTVAIKILSQLSYDPARKQRFEREARAISCLNHPNICTLHDIGHQDGMDYLVMECVEGETLAKRLERGPMPVDQVLRVGVQIADALDNAHRSRIVHRDLKPSNIVLTSTGAKLLDFGLAKPTAALVDVAAMTVTKAETPVTERGTIVGTFQYMSPEQVEGQELDGRSDIFSLGAVLYEMVTGQRAFEGKSRLSVASAILEKEPAPITTIKPLAPAALDHTIRSCLAKAPDDRWQTARDLSHELKWISEAGSQTGAPVVGGRNSRAMRERIAWATAGILLCTSAALGIIALHLKKTAPPPTAARAMIPPPPDNRFPAFENEWFLPALSPDGRQIVAPVRDSHEKYALWLRSLNDAGEGRILPGTEDGGFPFWSPDSRSIGFFAGGKLKRIDLEGNLVQILADVTTQPRGGTWSPDGIILYAPGRASPLYQIPASGGTPRQVTDPDKREQGHRWPVFLADGKHFLFFVRNQRQPELSGIYAGSLDSKQYHLVVNTTAGPAFAAGDRIVYVRNGVLITQGFDERTFVLSGEPVPLPDHVAVFPLNSSALLSVSPAGEMVYYPASSSPPNAISWYERDGRRGDTLDTAASIVGVALSPDGNRAVASIYNSDGLSTDLWNFDLSRGTKTRLTSGPETKQSSIWQPDGQFVLFASGFIGDSANIYRTRSDGSGGVETVLNSDGAREVPGSFCRDGRYLAYLRTPTDSTTPSIWILPLTGDRKPFPLVQSQFSNFAPAFSPDCKWVAYGSNTTGQNEVYLTNFPDATRRYQVSTQGGIAPHWRGDGKELFYRSPAQSDIMAVNVDEIGGAVSLGNPRALFHLANNTAPLAPYDVTPDGRRFLILTSDLPPSPVPLTLVTNWNAELKTK